MGDDKRPILTDQDKLIIDEMKNFWVKKEYPPPSVFLAKNNSDVISFVSEDNRTIVSLVSVENDVYKCFMIPKKYLEVLRDEDYKYYYITDNEKLLISSCRKPIHKFDDICVEILQKIIEKYS